MNFDELIRTISPYLGLLGLVGFIASFLTLKERFNNWKATKTKHLFEQQVKDFKKYISQYRLYDKQPAKLTAEFLESLCTTIALTIISLIIGGIAIFVVGRVLGLITPQEVTFILISTAVFLLFEVFGFCVFWGMYLTDYVNEDDFIERINKLLQKGENKGYIKDSKLLLKEIIEPSKSKPSIVRDED